MSCEMEEDIVGLGGYLFKWKVLDSLFDAGGDNHKTVFHL